MVSKLPPELYALHKIDHYVRSILANPDYDPSATTIAYFNKIVDICELGLKEVDDKEELLKISTSRKYTIAVVPILSLQTYGIMLNPPRREYKPLIMARSAKRPAASTAELAFDGIYDAIGHLARFMFPREYDEVVIKCSDKECIDMFHGISPKSVQTQSRFIKISEVLKEFCQITERPVSFEWWPVRSDTDVSEAYRAAIAYASSFPENEYRK